MKYPLPAMTVNKKECKHTMQPIVKFRLAKAGIISTLHTLVRYGPWSLGIIIIFDLFVLQGAGIIAFIIEHYCKSSPSIPLPQANIFTLQLEAEIGGRIL